MAHGLVGLVRWLMARKEGGIRSKVDPYPPAPLWTNVCTCSVMEFTAPVLHRYLTPTNENGVLRPPVFYS